MPEGRLVAVVDANIWLSAALSPRGLPARIAAAFDQGAFNLVVCGFLLNEIESVLNRARIVRRYQIDRTWLETLLEKIRERGITTEPVGRVQVARDPKDDYLIDLAVAGGANYLVTRDDDLKRDPAVVEYLEARDIQVVSVSQFLHLLEGR